MNDRAALDRYLTDALAIADRLRLGIAAIHINDALMVLPEDQMADASHMIDCVLTSAER